MIREKFKYLVVMRNKFPNKHLVDATMGIYIVIYERSSPLCTELKLPFGQYVHLYGHSFQNKWKECNMRVIAQNNQMS